MANERSRVEASQALTDQLGPAAAAALMECIPPFGWHEIATKTDLRHLEERMESRFVSMESRFVSMESRFVAIDHRFDALEAKLIGRFDQQAAQLLRWTVATVIGVFTAIGAGVAGAVALGVG